MPHLSPHPKSLKMGRVFIVALYQRDGNRGAVGVAEKRNVENVHEGDYLAGR